MAIEPLYAGQVWWLQETATIANRETMLRITNAFFMMCGFMIFKYVSYI